ncbi:hypothetical protein GUITHDRAFT_119369 [Guillardia theta CCMP2712]|uniref:Potassium channel domain-containing protein n=1 Tax=Guillardia theta (strain CCMP2712) TaxID=905079 RepID=L1IEV3_GUITC|nr:hypothetical protein GUITHDRAFT_119369 [Guillardia theta CCMP2712]EKX34444.1 hypothetical protein GUITHDRAFT_119369 [Guillardia theta CCMP2712]|eukprot:XP_005821424.1 hypothetical protein GUITHDRAFT_119369 [Guillardia theta CCMP2712]
MSEIAQAAASDAKDSHEMPMDLGGGKEEADFKSDLKQAWPHDRDEEKNGTRRTFWEKLSLHSPFGNKKIDPAVRDSREIVVTTSKQGDDLHEETSHANSGRLAILWNHPQTSASKDDRPSMRSLQARVHRMQLMVMVIAMLGLLMGISINEYCWLGYIPTPAEEKGSCSDASFLNQGNCTSAGYLWSAGIPNPVTGPGGQRCRGQDSGGAALKAFCTIFTCLLVMAIFRMYETIATEICFRNHLEYHREFADIPFWNLGLFYEFFLEVIFCIVHPAPGIGFNITIQARGRDSVYNIESVLVAVMFLRMYTVWRYFRTWMFLRYSAKNFASRMTEVVMDSKLAVKAILSDVPFETLAGCFVVLLFTLAYLLRIAEAPVNLEQVYYWNQLWLILEAMMSTGYGDLYPITHFGRGVCVFAMLGGITFTAILITAVARKLELNTSEYRLMTFLESEQHEKRVKLAAAISIQSWWRRAIHHPRTLQVFTCTALRQFKNRKKAYRKFLESTPHFGAFVENMKEGTEQVNKTLQKIEKAVSIPNLNLGRVGGAPSEAAKGNAGGNVGANPMSNKAFEELLHEIVQLRQANKQILEKVEKGDIHIAGAMPSHQSQVASAVVNSLRAPPSIASTARSHHNDPVVIASQAVEERMRRLENQVTNFDKGMALCLGQIVRLLQGLY